MIIETTEYILEIEETRGYEILKARESVILWKLGLTEDFKGLVRLGMPESVTTLTKALEKGKQYLLAIGEVC